MRLWLGGALLVVLIPGVIASLVLQYRSIERHQASELQADLELARAVGATFEAYVQGVLHHELAVGLAMPLALADSVETANGYLATSVAASPAVEGLAWVDPAGRIAAASRPSAVGTSVAERAYFQAAAGGQEQVVGDLTATPDGGASFVVARAIRDRAGLRGVVVAIVDPSRLGEAIGFARVQHGAVALLDRQGAVVYRHPGPDLAWDDRLSDAATLGRLIGARGTERAGFAALPWEDGAMTVGVSPIDSVGWSAVTSRPARAVTAPLLRDALQNLGVLLLVWGLALFVALQTARRVTRPIRALRAHLAALGQGELGRQAAVDGPAEIRDLASGINAMAEALAARDRQREDYTHAVSHDLRSPLTAILANVQLLRAAQARDGADERQRRRAESIELSALRMGAMIVDLVDAARLEGNQLGLQPVRVNLGRLAADLVERMGEGEGEADRVLISAAADLPTVAADRGRIERVLANLIGNALKYSTAPVRVVVGAGEREVRVEVVDEGPGIAPEELSTLFQRHARARLGRGRADSLGLGLYIARGIVEAHGGRVWVESSPGVGSTFGFALPAASAPGQAGADRSGRIVVAPSPA